MSVAGPSARLRSALGSRDLLVQTLGVAGLDDAERDVHKHLEEGQPTLAVHLARRVAVLKGGSEEATGGVGGGSEPGCGSETEAAESMGQDGGPGAQAADVSLWLWCVKAACWGAGWSGRLAVRRDERHHRDDSCLVEERRDLRGAADGLAAIRRGKAEVPG